MVDLQVCAVIHIAISHKFKIPLNHHLLHFVVQFGWVLQNYMLRHRKKESSSKGKAKKSYWFFIFQMKQKKGGAKVLFSARGSRSSSNKSWLERNTIFFCQSVWENLIQSCDSSLLQTKQSVWNKDLPTKVEAKRQFQNLNRGKNSQTFWGWGRYRNIK